ncbi:SulP family inorganic anion transporter [Desulfobotulus sp.]|jgi:SulP family sulfate permease|uniref:SulP family inorganic anion transporter n=1 Tax=Desulfobotulus sp. TaxID=1940337 RepID=UPI002A35AEA4|nr:SulP family inorganic anion transporter [Desulfobotulus sp.]MDY0162434.1 SulP family inorganic anion transporter [Desulfobotulus sp.]
MRPSFSLLREILSDLPSGQGLSGLSMGVITGLITLVVQVSFAAMIFAGPLQIHAQRAMGLTLAGAVVLLFLTALFGGFRSSISFPQDASTAIFAGAAAGMAAALVTADPDTVFITLVAALMLSTLVTGLFFILAARLRFAELLRFMPYPVVAGFLAGTGWLLTAGSLEVMTGLSLSTENPGLLFHKSMLMLWVPGLIYALVLFFCLRRWSHFLILPGSLMAAFLLCHAALALLGISMEEARNMGFFFTPFSSARIWPVFSLSDFFRVEWTVILEQTPTLILIPFIALIGLLLNTSGIELASQQDLNLNRELMVNGGGNILAAFTGAPAGYTSISLSLLGFKTGAQTRLVGLSAALLLGCTLFFGGQILSFFPKALLGGFLLLLGLSFLSDFILDTRSRMPGPDYAIVLAVFGIIGLFGYLQGVLFGLFSTIVLFVLRFSRIPTLARAATAASIRSARQRPLPHQRMLLENGHKIQVFELTGYLFFGSISTLASTLLEKIEGQQPRCIVMDFSKVAGFDVSAVNNFLRLAQKLSGRNLTLVLAAAPPRFETLLRQAGSETLNAAIFTFEDANTALEWSEERVLKEAQKEASQTLLQERMSKDALFDAVSDGLLKNLAHQEKVESLLKKLHPFLEIKSIEARAMILRSGQKVEAAVFVQEGFVREYRAGEGGKHIALRTLGPGTFFAEPAAYGPWLASQAYVAESPAELAFLTPSAFRKLEIQDPSTALELHRLLISGCLREGE